MTTMQAAHEPLVCFAHGKESGPWGIKIRYLADIARNKGFQVLSPDYSGTMDPHKRIRQLLQLAPRGAPLVLVGSSMGGYVSAVACEALAPDALFLLAPALYFEGFAEEPVGIPAQCTVVHGWRDDIVPVERSIRFAQKHCAELHLLDSGHDLNDQLPMLGLLFAQRLDRLLTTQR